MGALKNSKEVKERLNSPSNFVYHEHHIGRKEGAKTIPMPIKKVIAQVAQESSLDEVSDAFGISRREVGYLKSGETSSGPSEELKEVVKDTKEKAADKAIGILVDALNIIPGKLQSAKLKDLSSVAKNMSVIAENMRKKNPLENSQVQFNIFAPPVKSIEDYEVVDV